MLVSGKVNKMRNGPQGVWVSCRSSTTLSLYDSVVYVKLLEMDYTTLSPGPPISQQTVYTIMCTSSSENLSFAPAVTHRLTASPLIIIHL